MKAAIFHGVGKPLAVGRLDDPKPGPHDVIIKVHRCGICGTDLHMTSDHSWGIPAGTVLGHEYAGEVVELGSQVEGFKKGELITALPSEGCGNCDACAHGILPLCRNLRGLMGGFGEYMCIPTKSAIKLPRTFSAADGALVEPFAIGIRGVTTAAIKPGDRVLILGGGSVALTTTFWAKRLGAGRVVAASRSPRRAAMIEEMGADAFIQSGDNELQDVVEALGGPPDIVFECVGATGFLTRAIEHVRMFGHVVSMGTCMSPDPIVPMMAGMKAVRMSFPLGYTLRDFQYVADMMLAGDIDPKMIVTLVVPLDEFPAAFEKLREPNTQTKMHVSLTGA